MQAPPATAQEAMTLSGLCYAPPRKIAAHLADPALATRGEWRLVWGPARTPGSLMYVAHSPAASAYAVAIRGTVPNLGLDLLLNLYHDLHVGRTSAWEFPVVRGAAIAWGTSAGLAALLAMRSEDLTLEQFLRAHMLPAGARLVVTGHSLGGGLATVLAPYLPHLLGADGAGLDIVPITFAAPTAGNREFAAFFAERFPGAARWYNTLDVVPMAWADLPRVKELFPPPGAPCPREVRVGVDSASRWLKDAGLAYAQPGEGTALPGEARERPFAVEVVMQHHPATYLRLLGAPALPFRLVALPFDVTHLPFDLSDLPSPPY